MKKGKNKEKKTRTSLWHEKVFSSFFLLLVNSGVHLFQLILPIIWSSLERLACLNAISFYLKIQIHSSLIINTVAFTCLKVSSLIEQTLVKVIVCFDLIDDARSHHAIWIQVLSLVHFGVFSFQNKLKKKNDETSNKKIHLPFSKPRNCQKCEKKNYYSLSPSRLCDV